MNKRGRPSKRRQKKVFYTKHDRIESRETYVETAIQNEKTKTVNNEKNEEKKI